MVIVFCLLGTIVEAVVFSALAVALDSIGEKLDSTASN